ncbi:MAG: hypothetical protein LAT81_15425 [Oceanicaulis sp.]|nr:hypothetical protein [Oceanicaulis sp.]
MDDERMMTYAEAANALGVKVDSVKRRARNRRWRREIGNDGLARVAVPVSVLPQQTGDHPSDSPRTEPGDILRLEKEVSGLMVEVRMLRQANEELRSDRDAWRVAASHRWWHLFIRPRD